MIYWIYTPECSYKREINLWLSSRRQWPDLHSVRFHWSKKFSHPTDFNAARANDTKSRSILDCVHNVKPSSAACIKETWLNGLKTSCETSPKSHSISGTSAKNSEMLQRRRYISPSWNSLTWLKQCSYKQLLIFNKTDFNRSERHFHSQG